MTPRQFLAQYEKDNADDYYHDTYDRGLSPSIATKLYKLLKKSKSETSQNIVDMYFEYDDDYEWEDRGLTPQDTREIYKILNVKMRHYLDDKRNNPMKHNPNKNYIPTGKSAIRQAILKILQDGSKSLATDTKNVTKANIESYLGSLAENFAPSSLKSGAKFVRAIRDKSKVDGKLLFADGQKKDALTAFAKALDEGGVAYKKSAEFRSPKAKYARKAKQALKEVKRDIKGKVMGKIPELFLVTVQKQGQQKKEVLGGYASASSARAAARAYLSGIKKAYDPLIPTFTTGKTKTGRTSNRKDILKVDSVLYSKKDHGQAKAGEATFKFENNKALQYLKDSMKKDALIVRVEKINDHSKHRAYWKLFDSPSVGKLRWNPRTKR